MPARGFLTEVRSDSRHVGLGLAELRDGELGPGQDHAERVVEVVGDAGGHLPEGLDSLREDQLLLGRPQRLVGLVQLVGAFRPVDDDA